MRGFSTIKKWRQELKEGVLDFFDLWNTIFVLSSFFVVGLIFLHHILTSTVDTIPISITVAIFTAIYALIAFNQMRTGGPANTGKTTIRQDYRIDEDSEVFDFGLRNFGTSSALNLRIYARVTPNGPDLVIPESEYPLHLKEGEFTSLLRRDFAELSVIGSELYDRPDAKEIELYYTWESESGVQCPESLNSPREMEISELVDAAEDPRTEQLEDLRKNFTKRSQIVEETPR